MQQKPVGMFLSSERPKSRAAQGAAEPYFSEEYLRPEWPHFVCDFQRGTLTIKRSNCYLPMDSGSPATSLPRKVGYRERGVLPNSLKTWSSRCLPAAGKCRAATWREPRRPTDSLILILPSRTPRSTGHSALARANAARVKSRHGGGFCALWAKPGRISIQNRFTGKQERKWLILDGCSCRPRQPGLRE